MTASWREWLLLEPRAGGGRSHFQGLSGLVRAVSLLSRYHRSDTVGQRTCRRVGNRHGEGRGQAEAAIQANSNVHL